MASESWDKIKNRLTAPTVQELLEHTEDIDRKMEQVLVGLFNEMVDNRAKVDAVGEQLRTATQLVQTCQAIESRCKEVETSTQTIVQRAYVFAACNAALAAAALTIALLK